MVGDNTEEVSFFGGDVETVEANDLQSAAKVVTLILSVCSITFGVYILLAAMGGSL